MNSNRRQDAARRIQTMWRMKTRKNSDTGKRFPKMFAVVPETAPGLTFNARSLQRHIDSYGKDTSGRAFAKWPLHEPGGKQYDPTNGSWWWKAGSPSITRQQRNGIARKALSLQARRSEELAPLAVQALHGDKNAKKNAKQRLAQMGLIAIKVITLGNDTEVLSIKPNITVKTLEQIVGELTDQHMAPLRLIHSSQALSQPDAKISDYWVRHGSTIRVVQRIPPLWGNPEWLLYRNRPFHYDIGARDQRLRNESNRNNAARTIQAAFLRARDDPYTPLGRRVLLRRAGFDVNNATVRSTGVAARAAPR